MPDYQLLQACNLLWRGVAVFMLLADVQETYWRRRTRRTVP